METCLFSSTYSRIQSFPRAFSSHVLHIPRATFHRSVGTLRAHLVSKDKKDANSITPNTITYLSPTPYCFGLHEFTPKRLVLNNFQKVFCVCFLFLETFCQIIKHKGIHIVDHGTSRIVCRFESEKLFQSVQFCLHK